MCILFCVVDETKASTSSDGVRVGVVVVVEFVVNVMNECYGNDVKDDDEILDDLMCDEVVDEI